MKYFQAVPYPNHLSDQFYSISPADVILRRLGYY
jgi:hypothetical protein